VNLCVDGLTNSKSRGISCGISNRFLQIPHSDASRFLLEPGSWSLRKSGQGPWGATHGTKSWPVTVRAGSGYGGRAHRRSWTEDPRETMEQQYADDFLPSSALLRDTCSPSPVTDTRAVTGQTGCTSRPLLMQEWIREHVNGHPL